jgi:hypothetical protein
MLIAAPAMTGLVSHLRELATAAFDSAYYCEAISLGAGIAEEATRWQFAAIHAVEVVDSSSPTVSPPL